MMASGLAASWPSVAGISSNERFVGYIKMYGPPLGVKQKLEIVGGGLQKCIRPIGGANSWP
jgi:hypothetical protein